MTYLQNPNGITVAEFKRLVADWPETDSSGEPSEVWIGDGQGYSNMAVEACLLNSADLLISHRALGGDDAPQATRRTALRDDVAQQIFTHAMSESQGLGGLGATDLKTLLEGVALISFEAAEAFVRTRRLFDQKRRM